MFFRLRILAVEELKSLNLIEKSDLRSAQDLADSFIIPVGLITRITSTEELNKEGISDTKDVPYCRLNI
jgi:hypothetical protein